MNITKEHTMRKGYVVIDTTRNITVDGYTNLVAAALDRRKFAAEYPDSKFEVHQQVDAAGRIWRRVI